MKSIVVVLLMLISINGYSAKLQKAFPNLQFSLITELVSHDNRMFVIEKGGMIYVFNNDYKTKTKKLFLNVSSLVSNWGQTGLMGMAFHPNYLANKYFYLHYIKNDTLYISRFTTSSNPDSAILSSKVNILKIAVLYPGHYGGKLEFGSDGFLYIATGDSGNGTDTSGTASRRLNTLWGKLLRIDINNNSIHGNYSIPNTNPFYQNSLGYREEIYAYGFRNLWKFSFDNTGKIWGADLGGHILEEINWIYNGYDYGWNKKESYLCFPDTAVCDTTGLNLVDPIFTYRHFEGANNNNGAITGGYVSEDSISMSIFGKYVFADFVGGMVWSLSLPTSNLLLDTNLAFSTFGVSKSKELFICSYQGVIYRIRDNTNDVNRDGEVNLTDVLMVYNDMINYKTGIINTDINLDYIVDLTDLLEIYNN